MKILVFATLCLVMAVVAASNFNWPLNNNDARALQAAYDKATAWTWTYTRGRKVKRVDDCFTRWMDFSNFTSNDGWELQTNGNQNLGFEGWEMHSKPGARERDLYIVIFFLKKN